MITAGPIGRDPAQRLARDELSKAMYHPRQSIPQLIVHAINSFLNWLFSHASQATPGGGWTLLALAALVVIAIALVVGRVGPLAPAARRRVPVLDPGIALTARQLRESAQACAAEGDFSTAVLQRLRAIATSCEERGILVPDAGRTADELAAQAGALFPGQRGHLADAARLFDQVRYGEGTGTQAGYERLRALDDELAQQAPARAGVPA